MKPLRLKIQEEATLKKVPVHVIEKDYVAQLCLSRHGKTTRAIPLFNI